MSQIGTVVTTTEVPATSSTSFDTANAFVVGLADWGPTSGPVTIQSLPQVLGTVGPRSGTNTVIYDSLDVFFREGGKTAYFQRVVGPGASAASLVLQDASGSASVLLQAANVGGYGNQIQVAVANNAGSVVITLTDTYGNQLATSPSMASRAAIQAWSQTISYITAVPYANTAGLPANLAATAMSGGTDDRAHVTLAQWSAALNAFSITLGPGQIFAPGVTNTTVPGIWSAIGQAALNTNRVGLCDMDNGVAASVLVSAIGTAFNNAGVGPVGFWAGNLAAPGVVPNTVRSIPPSPVIAAICARVDSTGNPNLAGAGSSFPLQYCTGSYTLVSGVTETYSATDVSALNSAGINTFATRFGVFENFGFVSSILPTTDAIYWQFNHQRLRMALTAAAQIIAEPFLFSQLDGQGSDILNFSSALTGMLNSFWKAGALYGQTASAAFSINVGSTVNTPQALQSGQLGAIISVRMSPFAEQIDVVFNAVPITQTIPVGNSAL